MLGRPGRKSAAYLAISPVEGSVSRLQPPPHLDQAERALFIELVDACKPEQFVKSDLPLLTAYMQAILLSRSAIKDVRKDAPALNLWEKSTRMAATLATRLRLSPQSRLDAKTVARMRPANGKPPWEDQHADAD